MLEKVRLREQHLPEDFLFFLIRPHAFLPMVCEIIKIIYSKCKTELLWVFFVLFCFIVFFNHWNSVSYCLNLNTACLSKEKRSMQCLRCSRFSVTSSLRCCYVHGVILIGYPLLGMFTHCWFLKYLNLLDGVRQVLFSY